MLQLTFPLLNLISFQLTDTFDYVSAGILLLSFAGPSLVLAALFMMLSPIMPERAEAVKLGFPKVMIGIIFMSVASGIVGSALTLSSLFPTEIQPVFSLLAPLLAPGFFLLSFYYIISVVAPEFGERAEQHLGNIVFGVIFVSLISTLITNLETLLPTA